ncbi:hypothetical protein [Candidatus Paracaedibacter symbiosus]|uniref:hypothetical protein n=1 Tax=Candidatus Paracaedibacter symbiosus TaxID=244582 RepID=UPI001E572428|nr:hypothetical protein [Candidatus Paracaedibacter symbiosus]
MNMHVVEITDYEACDIKMMDALIPAEATKPIEKVIADDGAYYSKEGVEKLHNSAIIPAIPPPSNATVYGQEITKGHDKVVQYIKDKGSVYAFHKKYGYGLWALVEAQISRIKRCIGYRLKTHTQASLLLTSSISGTHSASAFVLKEDNCAFSTGYLCPPE